MAQLAAICGHCKEPSTFMLGQGVMCPEDDLPWLDVEVSAICYGCVRLSILTFGFFDREVPGDAKNQVTKFLQEISSDETLSYQPVSQHPSLVRPLPDNVPFDLYHAWKEAENAYSRSDMPTLATIAYRRVLESAARYLDGAKQPDKKPLGPRMKRLLEKGLISPDLLQLTQRALEFGNAAAHEATPLEDTDAQVARDLTDAFLSQAFSIPKLMESANEALEKRKKINSMPDVNDPKFEE